MAVDLAPLTDEQMQRLRKFIDTAQINTMQNDDLEYIYGMDGSVQVKHRPTMPFNAIYKVAKESDLPPGPAIGDTVFVTDTGEMWTCAAVGSWVRLSPHEKQMTGGYGRPAGVSEEDLARQRELYDAQKVLAPCIGGVADGRRIRHHLDENSVQLLELPNLDDMDAPKRFSNYRLLKVTANNEMGRLAEEIPLLVHEELSDGEAFRRIVNAYPEQSLRRGRS